MPDKYPNCPIVEAVCEFQLTPDTDWDPTVAGLVYERVKSEFPNKDRRPIHRVQSAQDPGKVRPDMLFAELAVFLTTDKKMLMHIGPHLFSLNALKPYPGWETFSARLESAFRTLTRVVNVKELQRIGLRYINRIELPGPSAQLDQFFEFMPLLRGSLPQDMVAFNVRSVFPFNGSRDLCKLELTNAAPEKSDNAAFILDLDYYLNRARAVSAEAAMEWVNEAHERVSELFEGAITDRLRKIFQGEN